MRLTLLGRFVVGLCSLPPLLTISAAPAWACRCEEPAVRMAYDMADVVVAARIKTLTPSQDESLTTTALVSRAWVSDVPRELTIITSTDCLYRLEVEREYVLFLFRQRTVGTYFTRRCRGNQPLENAQPTLSWLHLHGRTGKILALGP